jgi:hypothetical protein
MLTASPVVLILVNGAIWVEEDGDSRVENECMSAINVASQ